MEGMKLFEPGRRVGEVELLKDFLYTYIIYVYTILCGHEVYTENQPIEMYSGFLSASEIRAAVPMCYEVIVIIGFKRY